MPKLTRRSAVSTLAAGLMGLRGSALHSAARRSARLEETCEALTGLHFGAAQQHQMAGAVDEIIDRARRIAAQRLDNALPPAELFDPRPAGWAAKLYDDPPASAQPLPDLPKSAEDIAFAPAWQLSGWIKARQLRSRDLTEIYLDRISTRAAHLQCVATLLVEPARAESELFDREIAAGHWRGPLHGLPYGLKDLVDTANVRTAWGAEPYRDRVPLNDATIVTRLRNAGAVLLAKTACGALAYGDRWYGGQTRNPWNPKEGSFGSSSGSAAAVADGLCAFAIGTETMGSILAPASRCGAVGLRPTFGRIPRTGTMALCWSYDKIGAIARSPLDTLDVVKVLTGPDGTDLCASDEPLPPLPQLDPHTVRLGYRTEWFANGLQTDRHALDAARASGFQLIEINLPSIDLSQLAGLVVTESAASFRELTASGRDVELGWQDDIAWPNSWRAAQFETAVNYIQACRLRRILQTEFFATMSSIDAILHPSDAGGLMAIGNHCGNPAVTIPSGLLEQPVRAGFTTYVADNTEPNAQRFLVPFAVTLTGKLYDEARLVAIANHISALLGRDLPRPPVSRL